MAVLLLTSTPPARATIGPSAEPFGTLEAFMAGGAVGTLVLPAGAPDMLTPVIVILQDGEQPDGRAARYTDQLLGSGIAVLEMLILPNDALAEVLAGLALHPRLNGQTIGLLGLGAGARLAAEWSGPLAARALLYPGCAGLVPAAMGGEAVLLMHGGADHANDPGDCARLRDRLGASGAFVRLRTLDGASYAWDLPPISGTDRALLPGPSGFGHVVSRAWPAMAALSAAEVAGFFSLTLLGRQP